jgi:hypothetical protein
MSLDNIQTPSVVAEDGSSFTPVQITANGIEVTNAAEERRADGEIVPAGTESVFSVRTDTGSVINASYLKAGVIDASLMRTGLLQTVPSWNTKWAGASADHAAVQMGFTGGSIAATGVSTGTGTVTLTVPSGHGITTSDYIRVSGLYFTAGSLIGSVGLNLPYNGPVDYVQPTATAATTITYAKSDITSGLTANYASVVYVSKVRAITGISRTYDTTSNDAELSTVTVTTSADHGFSVGNYIEVNGTIDTLDGVWYVDSVPSPTTFTFKQRFGEDVEYDGTTGLSLPTLGAPSAIPVKKTYVVNSDGSASLALVTVSSADGNRPGIYIDKSTGVGDIAVPTSQVFNIGHWSGTAFTEDFRIDGNGNVRIFDGYFAIGPSSYDVFKVNFSGLVTVGNGSTVAGDLRVYGKSGVDGAVRIYGGASTSAGATLSFDSTNTRFNMNNDLNVVGGLTTTGTISAGSSISGGTASFGTINASGPINANYTSGTYAIIADDAIYVPEASGVYFGSGRMYYSSTSGYFTLNDDLRVTVSVTGSTDLYITSTTGIGTIARLSSARRYKQDIQDFNIPLNDVLQLRPVTFKWNPETANTEDTGTMTGLIAEEVESISEGMKRLCRYNEETGEIESVQYSQLPVFLIGAIKELSAKNEVLEARIAELETGA